MWTRFRCVSQLGCLGPVERRSLWAPDPGTEAGLWTRSHGDKAGIPALLMSFVDGQRAEVTRLKFLALALISAGGHAGGLAVGAEEADLG